MSRILVVNGSVRAISRTGALLAALADAVAAKTNFSVDTIHLATGGRAVLGALTRDELAGEAAAVVAQVEAADLLIIGSPVYRASYTGVLKHLFDLAQRPALMGKIALLAATGGSAQHGLMIEHQMRPLMNFFGTYIVPTGIFATEADFDGMQVASQAVRDRIVRAAEEAAWLARRAGAL